MKFSRIFQSFLFALGVFVYVVLITQFMQNGQRILGDQPDAIIAPFMLLLFVVSAAITSSLVFGKPVLMYLEGHKKPAIKFLFTTVAWLVVFMLMLFVTMAVVA
jgi:hypothetical protein